jgi:SAM-dependent methyltransferase
MIDPRDFEGRYRSSEEPWSFSERAAERLRHRWVVDTVRRFAPRRALDVGCSLGQLTGALAELPMELHGVDVSPTAVAKARGRIVNGNGLARDDDRVRFVAGSAVTLPLASSSYDFLTACDGLYSWELSDDERHRAVKELRRVLRVGGHALLTEHTRPARFEEFIGEITRGGLRVVSVEYLYDRPWYQFESWFRSVRGIGAVKRMLRSERVARALQRLGRLLGPNASRHICVLAVRDA